MTFEWRIFVLFSILLVILAAFVQSKLFLSPDVGYLLHASNLLLNGGNYVSDFLETNPPMILYLYLPACLLAKCFLFKLVLAIRIYIFALITLSAVFSFYLLKKIIDTQDRLFLYFFTFMMLTILLFLPFFEFGQREHLFLILTLPYYFSVVLALEKKPIPVSNSILIGLFAGLGIALKPFFLIPFCLLEFYVIWRKRSLFSWIRAEPLMIMVVILGYLIVSIFWHYPYYHIILPLVFHFYFPAAKSPWIVFLTDPLFYFCIVSCFFYLCFFRNNPYKTLNSVICIALLGMIIGFLIPRSDWFYHILPALSMAYLLMASCMALRIFNNGVIENYLSDVFFFVVCSLLIFSIPALTIRDHFKQLVATGWLKDEKELAKILNSQPGKHSMYCVSTVGTADCFPLVYDAKSQFVGRFPFFWWYKGLKKLENNSTFSTAMAKEKNFLIQAFSDDLNRYQPRWIIVNVNSFTDWNQENIQLAAENKLYQQAWGHYHYSMSVDHYQIFTRN